MAMGREGERQGDLVVTWTEMPRSPRHVFYDRLQEVLIVGGFDLRETACRPYYAAKMGAPSVPPGRYFRMHMVGYFEGIDCERGHRMALCGLASRCGSSCGLGTGRAGAGFHPWLCRRREAGLRMSFTKRCSAGCWRLIARHGLVKGERIGVDASTMEANAALGTPWWWRRSTRPTKATRRRCPVRCRRPRQSWPKSIRRVDHRHGRTRRRQGLSLPASRASVSPCQRRTAGRCGSAIRVFQTPPARSFSTARAALGHRYVRCAGACQLVEARANSMPSPTPRARDIHLGPGQEKHLPHEAWHVVQQKQGQSKGDDADDRTGFRSMMRLGWSMKRM